MPDGVVERLFDSVRNAASVRGLAPVALAGHVETFDAEATTRGAVPEMVLTPAVFDHLVESRPDRLREQIREGEFEFLVGPIEGRFGLWIAEHEDRPDEAGLLVYTDTGVGGVAINDTQTAVAWARSRYEAARETAEPVTLDRVDERAAGRSRGRGLSHGAESAGVVARERRAPPRRARHASAPHTGGDMDAFLSRSGPVGICC
ncbi:hypothetical protein ACFQRB_15985 [Halobaculum litoreum]|uniref:Methanogenesis regulatory protein FilR1 middle domain-containing protein n=1 Tax=Halobaculum litoreum TaxID=3031998 RepID=A0ABD5XV26_9EURY